MSTPAMSPYFLALLREHEMLGMLGLGKIADPASNEAQVDLAKTQFAIAVLEMLEQKTTGNLADAERQELRRVLTTLRLNYVEEMNSPQAPGERAGSGEIRPEAHPDSATEDAASAAESTAGETSGETPEGGNATA
jgi:hypothetical protein